MKALFAIVTACFVVAACGGGGDNNPGGANFVPEHGHGPQLRPCETTGPTAPPCPASAAQ